MGSSIIKTSLRLCIWNKANWYLQICVPLDSILIPRLMCNYIWNYSCSHTAVYCNMTFYVHENHLKSRTQLFDFWEPEMILITFISGLLNNGKNTAVDGSNSWSLSSPLGNGYVETEICIKGNSCSVNIMPMFWLNICLILTMLFLENIVRDAQAHCWKATVLMYISNLSS